MSISVVLFFIALVIAVLGACGVGLPNPALWALAFIAAGLIALKLGDGPLIRS
jgi:hypothetical protein